MDRIGIGWSDVSESPFAHNTFSMHVDDVSCDGLVCDGIALVQDHEE